MNLAVYETLSRIPFLRSYRAKVWAIAFVSTHIPLIALGAYFLLSHLAWRAVWPSLLVVLLATLAGSVLGLAALRALLRPIGAVEEAMEAFRRDGRPPALPTHFQDDVGRLMVNTQATLVHLYQLITFKDRLLGIFAHDSRTPSATIRMAAELLEEELGTPEPDPALVTDLLSMITQSADFQMGISQSLLDMARDNRTSFAVHPAPVALPSLLEAMRKQFEILARSKQIQFSVRDQSALATLFTDGLKVRQVLGNVVANAIKFTPAGGMISLIATAVEAGHGGSAERIQFIVEDTGVGIPIELQARLFEPYNLSGRLGTDQEVSSGLGLWIARTLTEQLGGTISLESRDGEGTRVYVELPTTIQPSADLHSQDRMNPHLAATRN